MLNRLEEDNLFLNKIVFSDEATFHLSGKVNRHNLIIWGSQNPHQVVEYVRDSPKVNVFCAVGAERRFMDHSLNSKFYYIAYTHMGIILACSRWHDISKVHTTPHLKMTL
jgi:hypothetical protein